MRAKGRRIRRNLLEQGEPNHLRKSTEKHQKKFNMILDLMLQDETPLVEKPPIQSTKHGI
jgi:hypothetical protein